jgi:hypothetical protein
MTKTLTKKPLLDNIRRGELKRLLLHRKVSKLEVHNMVEDIIAERAKWTARALGRRMDLTFDEKIRLGIRTIRCIDRSEMMMKLYFREQKRERDRIRWHRRKQSLACGLSPGAKKLADRLSANKWLGVGDIVEQLGKCRRRKREAARSAVRRALSELKVAGLLEVRMQARPTGGFERSVRLKKPENPALLSSSTRENTVVIDVIGDASDFRPPVKRPPVKFSPLHRRSSTKPSTTPAQPPAKDATRLIDSYYAANTAKAALPQRGGRAGARSKVGGLEIDRPNKRAAKREGVPPSGGQLLYASKPEDAMPEMIGELAAHVTAGGKLQ